MKIRITGGEMRSRVFNVPESDQIRPTTNRVKETLFNILNNIIDLEDINVLDIYAGSGALGFESLSRGAATIHYVERNNLIYSNLERNIKELGVADRCKIFKMEAVKFSKLENHNAYDLILLDPPFFKDDVYETVINLLSNNFLKDDGLMIIERSIQTKQKDINNFRTDPFKIIGDTCLYRLQH